MHTLPAFLAMERRAVSHPIAVFVYVTNMGSKHRITVERGPLFRGYFAQLLDADVKPFEKLVQADRDFERTRWSAKTAPTSSHRSVPTPTQPERIMVSARWQKAVGEDLAGGDAFTFCPREMAAIFHPAVAKSIFQLRPPFNIEAECWPSYTKEKGQEAKPLASVMSLSPTIALR